MARGGRYYRVDGERVREDELAKTSKKKAVKKPAAANQPGPVSGTAEHTNEVNSDEV